MGYVLKELLDAALRVGAPVTVLTPELAGVIRRRVVTQFVRDSDGHRIWEGIADPAGVQDPDAWRWIDAFLTDVPAVLFFDHTEEESAVRFEHGSQITGVIADATRFEFYVTDDDVSFLLAANHHDFLIAAGAAKSWLESHLA